LGLSSNRYQNEDCKQDCELAQKYVHTAPSSTWRALGFAAGAAANRNANTSCWNSCY
jgi:hypothetical protein